MKKTILILVIFLLGIVAVLAQENHDSEIEEGKNLVESKISCDKLSDEQLEAMGDYYMEQMHPGEAHEMMDQMMGGEGSDSLKQMHITMAKRLYCNEDINRMMYSGGMMGMMPMMPMMNMMGGYYNGYGSGMMFLVWLTYLLIIALIVAAIYWLIKSANRKK